jgi:hypothetical protein
MTEEAHDTILPRRPVRAVASHADAPPEWRARPETLPNLFSDLFGEDPEVPVEADRIARSRHRIAAAAAAREAARTPELFNLWHDVFAAPPESALAAEPANDRPDLPPTDDDRIARIRAALYAPLDGEEPARAAPSVQMRLAVHAMNGTLIAVAAPVGAAVMTYSLLRGEDMRLTARALTVCGALMTVFNLGMPLV